MALPVWRGMGVEAIEHLENQHCAALEQADVLSIRFGCGGYQTQLCEDLLCGASSMQEESAKVRHGPAAACLRDVQNDRMGSPN